MDERAAFEKWLLEVFELDDEWIAERNCYRHFAANLAWRAWQKAESVGFAHGSGDEGWYQRRISQLEKLLATALAEYHEEYGEEIGGGAHWSVEAATLLADSANEGKA